MDLIAESVNNVDAVRTLADAIGLQDYNPWGPDVGQYLDRVESQLGRLNNKATGLATAADLGIPRHLSFSAPAVIRPQVPLHLTGRPDYFPEYPNYISPQELSFVSLPDGYFCDFSSGPLTITPDGKTVLRDYSSHHSQLVYYYEVSVGRLLAQARYVDGTVMPIADDARPTNYCHWMLDWLPRLAALGDTVRRADFFVAVCSLNAPYQRESLRMCGIDPNRIIELGPFETIRAKRLVVPDDFDTWKTHPAHKAAPWTIDYLHSKLGMSALLDGRAGARRPEKIYISRRDASWRRVLNDDELIKHLEGKGYTVITPGELPLAEQIASFARAKRIISLHGAGLANVAFCSPDCSLIEIFPRNRGTPAFCVLAAAVGCSYLTYVSDDVVAGGRADVDDIMLDVDDFMDRCGPYL